MTDEDGKAAIQSLKGDIANLSNDLGVLEVKVEAIRKRQDELAIAINAARDDVISALGDKIHDEVAMAAGEIGEKIDTLFTALSKLSYQYRYHGHDHKHDDKGNVIAA